MGQRSRKRRRGDEAGATPRPPRKPAAERDAEVREQLEPLAEGERPGAVTAGAIVAAVLAVANLVFAIAGYELDEDAGGPGSAVLYAVILGAAAWGMWHSKYWAVLGFQAVLVITAAIAFLSLMVASNVWGALLSTAMLAGAGFLFYKLIRAMARIQMPERRPS